MHPMPITRHFRILLAAVAVAALLWLLFAAAERALALAQRFLALPGWLQGVLGLVLLASAMAGLTFLWMLFRPGRRRRPAEAPDRATLEGRISQLEGHGVGTGALHQELAELDRRQAEGQVYVAVFGEISAGKSSLVAALAAQAAPASDVRGGTTRTVAHYDGSLPDGRPLRLADVPGSREAGGEARETMAREEVLRAHAVVYLCIGDLSRNQAAELAWLADFAKPLVLALNKADQWSGNERQALLARLRAHARGIADAVVAISAGGSERFQRTLADGRIEQVERPRQADVAPLLDALARLTAAGAQALEGGRQRAVLAGLHERTGALESDMRSSQSEQVVARYTRRAVVGALAAVVPGSDLLIQGALATAMTRELARLYAVPIKQIEIEDFLRQARMTLRTSASVVLAIAGNAMKAFPGLGTLGGGVLHAFAYALIFDSLGKALATTLAQHHALDQQEAGARLKALLAEGNPARIRRLGALTLDALRSHDDKAGS